MKKSNIMATSHSTSLHNLALQSKLNCYRQKFNSTKEKYSSRQSWVHTNTIQPINKVRSKSMFNLKPKSALTRLPSTKIITSNNQESKIQNKLNLSLKSNKSRKSSTDNAELNPQLINFMTLSLTSKLLTNLDSHASQMMSYQQQNTRLLSEKRRLEQHISFLNAELTKEKKIYNSANFNNNKNTNQLQNKQKFLKQTKNKNNRLQQSIHQHRNLIKQLTVKNNKFKNTSQNNNQQIQYQKDQNQKLLNIQIKNNKQWLLNEDAERLRLKNQLQRQLKVMDNLATYHQQLEKERAYLRHTIQSSVMQNMMSKSRTQKTSSVIE